LIAKTLSTSGIRIATVANLSLLAGASSLLVYSLKYIHQSIEVFALILAARLILSIVAGIMLALIAWLVQRLLRSRYSDLLALLKLSIGLTLIGTTLLSIGTTLPEEFL